ncbi:ribonuclease III, partial [Basidiobolus meristosporus CBS 931.73]
KLCVSIRMYLILPFKQEGQLHIRRIKSISNSALYRNAVKLELYRYVTSTPFNRKHWLPPNFTMEDEPLESGRSFKHSLSDKTLADIVEASLGACYLSQGVESALDCAIKMMIPFPEIKHWKEFATLNNAISPSPTCDEAEFLYLDIEAIESSINYNFRNKRLLYEAFTHPSCPNPNTSCYQRLEFLGDAVLDFLVVSYLFERYPGLKPANITELKGASVSNNFLSFISHSLGLHQHLIHSSSALSSNLMEFIDQMEKMQQTKQNQPHQYWLKLIHRKRLQI